MDVIAIFNLGTASSRLLLFDQGLNVVYTEEKPVAVTSGMEGLSGPRDVASDGAFTGNKAAVHDGAGTGNEAGTGDGAVTQDTEVISAWMRSSLGAVINTGDYNVRAVNTVLHGPVSGHEVYNLTVNGLAVKPGVPLHESYASMVPYLKGTKEHFILVATGTWCVFMNPFNTEPRTVEQPGSDEPEYMRINGRQIKSSRLFLGHIHDMNVARLDDRFGVTGELFKTIKIKSKKIRRMLASRHGRIFFRHGVPPGYVDDQADLSHFLTYADAYHQMVCDLVDVSMEYYRQIIPADDKTEIVYITGGFARNDTFVRILAARIPDKRVFASQIDNPSALGAAIDAYENAFGNDLPPVYLGLKAIIDND